MSLKESLKSMSITLPPESQIDVLVQCATLAQKENQPTFPLNGTQYNVQNVFQFMESYHLERAQGKNITSQDMELRAAALEQFARDGSVLGQQVPAGQECQFLEVLTQARKNGYSSFEFEGKEYPSSVSLPAEEQLRCFGNINEEIKSPQSTQTKQVIQNIAAKETLDKDASGLDKFLATTDKKEEILQKIEKMPQYAQRLQRHYNLNEACGYPEIKSVEDDNGLVGRVAEAARGQKTPHFEPNVLSSGGTVYLRDEEDYVPEMAHAFRNHNNVIGETGQFIGDGLKDILTFNSLGFTPQAQQKNYNDKTKMEYDTHSVVEPNIKAYLDGKTETIPQMYAQIDSDRKKKDISYTQTSQAATKRDLGKKELEVKKLALIAKAGKTI